MALKILLKYYRPYGKNIYKWKEFENVSISDCLILAEMQKVTLEN